MTKKPPDMLIVAIKIAKPAKKKGVTKITPLKQSNQLQNEIRNNQTTHSVKLN